MSRKTQQVRTTKPLSNRQSWVLQWFATATTKDRDAVEGIMIAVRKDFPLPHGWWREGEGREACAMNARTAAEARAFLKRDRAWRAEQARASAGGR